jgi:hypothetical protein
LWERNCYARAHNSFQRALFAVLEWSIGTRSSEAEVCFWRMYLSQQRQHGFSFGKVEGRLSVLPDQGLIMSVLPIATHQLPTFHSLVKVKVFDARVLL